MSKNVLKFMMGGCILLTVVAVAGCKAEKRGPVEVTAAAGKFTVKAVIGKEGGSLILADGGAKLTIPADLLMEDITVALTQVKPSFDLSGKDVVGHAYRISPRLTFAPGLARLYVPLDRGLPGLPQEIGLGMYVYDSVESDGPSGPSLVHTWKAHSLVKFAGFSTDQKYLMFDIHETISDRTTKAPFGLFQAAFNM